MMFFKRLLCRIFDHKPIMFFRKEGVYWCWSAGPYDCGCERCDHNWAQTLEGQEALERSRKRDPRHNPNMKLEDIYETS
jgi:hypothetical protein